MRLREVISLILTISFLLVDFSAGQTTAKSTILSQFNPPNGYKRITYKNHSFADWIRNLPLKQKNSAVFDYRGKVFKSKDDTTVAAVVE